MAAAECRKRLPVPLGERDLDATRARERHRLQLRPLDRAVVGVHRGRELGSQPRIRPGALVRRRVAPEPPRGGCERQHEHDERCRDPHSPAKRRPERGRLSAQRQNVPRRLPPLAVLRRRAPAVHRCARRAVAGGRPGRAREGAVCARSMTMRVRLRPIRLRCVRGGPALSGAPARRPSGDARPVDDASAASRQRAAQPTAARPSGRGRRFGAARPRAPGASVGRELRRTSAAPCTSRAAATAGAVRAGATRASRACSSMSGRATPARRAGTATTTAAFPEMLVILRRRTKNFS